MREQQVHAGPDGLPRLGVKGHQAERQPAHHQAGGLVVHVQAVGLDEVSLKPAPVVVAGDEHHRHAPRHLVQQHDRRGHRLGRRLTAVEQVAGVHHQIHLLVEGGRERCLHRGEVIVGAAPAGRSAAHAQLRAEVGVAEVKQAHRGLGGASP